MISPTFKSTPVSGCKILAKYPSSYISNPTLALSVSISHKTSPAYNLSPSFFIHSFTLPLVIVGLKDGKVNF